ncbi:MAG: hypothetical protein HC880_08225, partial [Bacteroidia bacterium]|nr:hypothetical protein [Bacteroidia bacterium]
MNSNSLCSGNASSIIIEGYCFTGTLYAQLSALDTANFSNPFLLGSMPSGDGVMTINLPDSLSAGTYYIRLVNDSAEVVSNLLEIEVLPLPLTTVSGRTTLEAGDTLRLTANETGATYVWKRNGEVIDTTATLNIPDISLDQGGEYVLEVTKNGCTASQVIRVVVECEQDFLWAIRAPGGAVQNNGLNNGAWSGNTDYIKVDQARNVYLTGYFQNTVNFGGGTSTLVSSGFRDMYLAKFNAQGKVIWAQRLGGSSTNLAYDYPTKLYLDDNNNIYLCGTIAGNTYLGKNNNGQDVYLDAGGGRGFLAKYNADGVVQWVKNGGYNGSHDVAVDRQGFVYNVGSTGTSNIDFGNGVTLSGNGLYVVKYTSDGQAVTAWGGFANSYGL